MARSDKVAAVAGLAGRFSSSAGVVLTEYRGLSVKALMQLRRSLGDDASYAVSKNTLTTIAAREAGLEAIEQQLVGPTAIAFLSGHVPFVGSLADGTIWRGDLRTGSVAVLAAGAPGRASAGIAYEPGRDRIWVAGVGPPLLGTADVRVYDASSGALLATLITGVALPLLLRLPSRDAAAAVEPLETGVAR